jgi:hypothetical protein
LIEKSYKFAVTKQMKKTAPVGYRTHLKAEEHGMLETKFPIPSDFQQLLGNVQWVSHNLLATVTW